MKFLYEVFPYALAYTAPILITALGGLMSERSGVINIGLEGLMIVGSFIGTITVFLLNEPGSASISSIILALLLATLGGGIFALLHAYASISLRANQIISGTAINMLAMSGTLFFAELITGAERVSVPSTIHRGDVAILSSIPFIGKLFFTKAFFTTYLVIFIALFVWYLMYKRPFGLRLRSCGEFPGAASSVGIKVVKMRYIGVVCSGLLAGLGGAIVTLTYKSEFNGTVEGLGFLALATLIFGKWKPVNVMFTALFFGFMKTFSTMASINDSLKALSLPQEFYRVLPYAITIIALIIVSKNSEAPKALGEVYDPSKR